MRILHAIHDFLPRHRAGSEIYALNLAKELVRRGHHVTILCAEYDPSKDHGSLTWRSFEGLTVVEMINNWIFRHFSESYRPPEFGSKLAHVLQAVGPHILHLHSLLNLSFDLPLLARQQDIASVATLHDFTLVCPSGGQRIHLAEEHVCVELDSERCARCFPESPFHSQMVLGNSLLGRRGGGVAAKAALGLRSRWPSLTDRLGRLLRHTSPPGFGAGEIDSRLEAFRETVFQVDRWIAPSQALADDFLRFGIPEERLEVSDYGFPNLSPAERQPGDGRLHIGFVGTLVWHKGVHILLEAAKLLPIDRFVLHLFGDTETFPSYCDHLRELADGLPVVFEGRFEASEIAEAYARIDTLVVSSLWPENSPLVIHEAFQAGVPVVGSRLGGTVNLVRHEIGGLLYEADRPEDLALALQRLIDDPSLLASFRKRLPAVKSIAQDATEWEARYEEVLSNSRAG